MALAYSAIAPMEPKPVKGFLTINGQSWNAQEIKVTNLDTNEVLTSLQVPSLKSYYGIFFFDMSEFKEGYYAKSRTPGDMIEVKACSIGEGCTLTFEADDSVAIQKLYMNVVNPDYIPPKDDDVIIPPKDDDVIIPPDDDTTPPPDDDDVIIPPDGDVEPDDWEIGTGGWVAIGVIIILLLGIGGFFLYKNGINVQIVTGTKAKPKKKK